MAIRKVDCEKGGTTGNVRRNVSCSVGGVWGWARTDRTNRTIIQVLLPGLISGNCAAGTPFNLVLSKL